MNKLIIFLVLCLSSTAGFSWDEQVYLAAKSKHYNLTNEQAIEVARKNGLNTQVFFTSLTPSYGLSFKQALIASTAKNLNVQLFFTQLTPSYQVSFYNSLRAATFRNLDMQIYLTALNYEVPFHEALEAGSLRGVGSSYLHFLGLGHSHRDAIKFSQVDMWNDSRNRLLLKRHLKLFESNKMLIGENCYSRLHLIYD